MFNASLKSGITRTFRHAASDNSPQTDEYGFISPSPSSLTIDQVLSKGAIVVRGQPWIGKSFVAEEIYKQREALGLGEHVWLLQLADHSSGRSLVPGGWNDWLAAPGRRACLVVDSVDEGESIQRNIYTEIIKLLEDSGKETCRERLKIVVFVREAEIPQRLSKLCEFLDTQYGQSFADVELLPLDRENAERVVGLSQIDATLAAIQRHSLMSVAGYPAALEYISRNATDDNLTEVDVWRGVLTELLRERRPSDCQQAEPEHLFCAAARLAAVMTFADIPQLAPEGVGARGIEVGDLIGANPVPNGPTRTAARQAVRTAMFLNGRFAQKNIREWMCAFGVSDVGLARLRPLITDDDGNLAREHFGVLSLLHKTTNFEQEVATWLREMNGGFVPQSDVKLSLEESLSVVDRLESISDTSNWNVNLWGERGLKELATPGLGAELAHRIRDTTRSSNRRNLLLQIAIQTSSLVVLDVAVELVQDLTEHEELRQTALSAVIRIGRKAHFRALESFVRETQPTTRIEKAIVSAIIEHYLVEGVWSIEECVRFAPTANGEVIDSTLLLASKLQEGMTVEAARTIVDQRLRNRSRKQRRMPLKRPWGERREDELIGAALCKLLVQDPPGDKDLVNLIPLFLDSRREAVEFVLDVDVFSAYARSPVARRAIFLEEHRRNNRRKPSRQRKHFLGVLTSDDIEWLMERVVRLASKDDSIWEQLLCIARGAPEPLKRKARRLVKEERPDIVAAFDKSQRRNRLAERRRIEQKKRDEQQRTEKPILIEDVVLRILHNDGLGLESRMYKLARICFGGDQERPRNVRGNWNDLPQNVQADVLDTCQKGLQECRAVPIPDGSRFPGQVVYGGWCFRDVLLKRQDRFPLTGELIRKWLPAVLLFSDPEQDEVVAVCHSADVAAVEQVFLDAIMRELRNNSEYMIFASNLSVEYWSQTMADAAIALVNDDQYHAESRAELLRIIAARVPHALNGHLKRMLVTQKHDCVWHAALDSLLSIDASEAWEYLLISFQEFGRTALLELRSLYHYRSQRINLESAEWTSKRLLELARMLYIAFLPEEDADDACVTPEQELSELRNNIPHILLQRATDDAKCALEELVAEQPHLKDWHIHAKAQEQARGELAFTGRDLPGLSNKGAPPYGKIVKLLENASYRIVRSQDDLLAVIEEELLRIGREAGRHIEMLYLPNEISGGNNRRHEAALQSYIDCRLSDRLPGRILDPGTTVSIHRERQVQFRQRTDIQIEAPLVNSGLGQVVIEVKWSDNDKRPNISTALMKQLGDNYLRGDDKTHGIYLVGWNGRLGKWRTDAGQPPDEAQGAIGLQTALQRQAAEYMDTHAGIRIVPVVFDLVWPSERNKKLDRKQRGQSA